MRDEPIYKCFVYSDRLLLVRKESKEKRKKIIKKDKKNLQILSSENQENLYKRLNKMMEGII
ncbi:MAG: hypothetical protein ACYDBV_13430 [Nitrospiria bacterium]